MALAVQADVFALLACGHALADFVVQTRGMVEAKRTSPSAFSAHVLLVGLVHAAVALPFAWGTTGVLLVAVIAAAHGAIDLARLAYERRRPAHGVRALLADQALHVAVLAVAAAWWPAADVPARVVDAAAVVALIAFNGTGAAAIVAASLRPLQAGDEEDDGPRGAGRRIGMLERWMILGLVSLGEWGAVGLVLTAKSVARFRKMDQQAFAEVYLVGTMTSVIVAMASGLVLQLVL